MSYSEELSKIEQKVNGAKLEKATLEERKRNLEQEQTKILEELKKEEIGENKLEDVIMDLEVEIQEGIDKCKDIIK